MSEPVDDSPLRGPEVSEVLRYWLAALRFEEALTSRPRAHRLRGRPTVDLAEPRGGQPYFKLKADTEGAAFLTRSAGDLLLDLDAERTAFFARWLRLAYIREASPFPGWDGDASAVVVGWPVVYFPRTEELAGLFRMRASTTWYRPDGKRFEPPSYRDRRAGRLPPAPTQLRLETVTDEEGLLPYSFDTQLLVRTLGVTDEEVGDLEAVLKAAESPSAEAVVATVCDLLEATEGWAPKLGEPPEAHADDPEAQFARVLAAVRGRLPPGRGGPAVYGVGLVHDGDQVFATRHLQRELSHLLERRVGAPPWGRKTPLWGYLSGKAPPAGHAPMRGLRAPRAITDDQRAVAEAFLASPLSAAQGPPGTGKTELLLNLGAAALVERIDELATGGSMPRDLLLVASTNNRAVDHVLEPLSGGMEGPPLGLRVGNLQVLNTVSLDTFAAAQSWLMNHDVGEAQAREREREALAAFRAARAAVDAADAPRLAARRHIERRRVLDERIAARQAALERIGDPPGAPAPEAAREVIDKKLRALATHLDRIAKAIDRRGSDLLARVMTIWSQAGNRVIKPLDRALAGLDAPPTLALDLPPTIESGADEEAHLSAWQAGIEGARAAMDGVRKALDDRELAEDCRAALASLRDERALIPAAGEAPEGADAGLHFALFEAALAARAAWAAANNEALRGALQTAIEAVSERRTLRRLAEDDPGAIDWLTKLFPVWGSTLLSLGNVLPAQPITGLRLVLDEAGQCHPAYAVSGLMRAEQALLIGDVHQLEPVIQLRPEDEGRIRAAARIGLDKTRLGPYRVMEGSGNSAQSLADRAVGERPTLRAHFRCQAPIIALSDALCGYGLTVRTPAPERFGPPPLPGPVLLSPVSGAQQRVRGSWHNPAELDAVLRILAGLQRYAVPWGDVAVITPYVGQLDALREAVRRMRIPVEHVGGSFDEPDLFGDTGIALGTVHRFQGGERRVVIFSTVVTRGRSLGFLNGRVNLLNVAVSRAREHLVVVGDPETLRGGAYSRLLVERAAPLLLDG